MSLEDGIIVYSFKDHQESPGSSVDTDLEVHLQNEAVHKITTIDFHKREFIV